MRMHIEIADVIVAEIDAVAGPRRRSAFVRDAVLSRGTAERPRERQPTRLGRRPGRLGESSRSGDPQRVG